MHLNEVSDGGNYVCHLKNGAADDVHFEVHVNSELK